jgi:hypothetical protein
MEQATDSGLVDHFFSSTELLRPGSDSDELTFGQLIEVVGDCVVVKFHAVPRSAA